MARHAGSPARHKAPFSTGRLALWLLFAFFMACLILGTVVNMTGKGA